MTGYAMADWPAPVHHAASRRVPTPGTLTTCSLSPAAAARSCIPRRAMPLQYPSSADVTGVAGSKPTPSSVTVTTGRSLSSASWTVAVVA